ncbi:MAG: hypothetical protein CEE40_10840 [Chloroflexi bacterium B3_Chlor]|nr:MAG: hypothetical protein CEE40_10840 [Chloroflexi bacterium B3_Chlor]
MDSCGLMSKVYSELVYHFVWGTRDRLPVITSDVEARLVAFFENKCRELGYRLHAVGCVQDHVHLLVTLTPSQSASEVAKNLKGSSSYLINKQLGPRDVLYWQRGYGVLTLRKKDVPIVAEYIRRQKEHHQAERGLIARLECVEGRD